MREAGRHGPPPPRYILCASAGSVNPEPKPACRAGSGVPPPARSPGAGCGGAAPDRPSRPTSNAAPSPISSSASATALLSRGLLQLGHVRFQLGSSNLCLQRHVGLGGAGAPGGQLTGEADTGRCAGDVPLDAGAGHSAQRSTAASDLQATLEQQPGYGRPPTWADHGAVGTQRVRAPVTDSVRPDPRSWSRRSSLSSFLPRALREPRRPPATDRPLTPVRQPRWAIARPAPTVGRRPRSR